MPIDNTNMMSVPGLVKAKRDRVKKHRAVNMKPPEYRTDPLEGDNHKFFIIYVNANHKQVRAECTWDVWRKVEGQNREGEPRDGYDSRLYDEFVVVESADSGLVVDVDIMPKNTYSKNSIMPDNVSHQKTINLRITQNTGSIEVTQVPPGVTKPSIMKLMNELDKVDTVKAGDILPGGFEILEVAGNRVAVRPGSHDQGPITSGF